MEKDSDLLYSAYQKFYSALKALDRFSLDNDFCDNISSLDCFLSEFRNITFTLQNSIAHTKYKEWYELNRDNYLSECNWLKDKRNEITKEKPFGLKKEIALTVYSPNGELETICKVFNIENDCSLESFLNDIKSFLKGFNSNEVFFSAEYLFYDDEHQIFWNEIFRGIECMNRLLEAFHTYIGECNQSTLDLIKHIDDLQIKKLLRNQLFVRDFAYYPNRDEFEESKRSDLLPFGNGKKSQLKEFVSRIHINDPFLAFIILHIVIGTTDLMPTIMIVYDDGTYTMESFHGSLKTTMYRRINDAAKMVKNGGVNSVFLMMTYVSLSLKDIDINSTSRERIKNADSELLAFAKVDKNLSFLECVFDENEIKNEHTWHKKIIEGISNELFYSRINMSPIIRAFASL